MATLTILEGTHVDMGWGTGSLGPRPHLMDDLVRVSDIRTPRPHLVDPTYSERHAGFRRVPITSPQLSPRGYLQPTSILKNDVEYLAGCDWYDTWCQAKAVVKGGAKVVAGSYDWMREKIDNYVPKNLNPIEWVHELSSMGYNLATDPRKTLSRWGDKLTSWDYWKKELMESVPGGENTVRRMVKTVEGHLQDALISQHTAFRHLELFKSLQKKRLVLKPYAEKQLTRYMSQIDEMIYETIHEWESLIEKLVRKLSTAVSDNFPLINIPAGAIEGLIMDTLYRLGVIDYTRQFMVQIIEYVIKKFPGGAQGYFPLTMTIINTNLPEAKSLKKLLNALPNFQALGFVDSGTYEYAQLWGKTKGLTSVNAALWQEHLNQQKYQNELMMSERNARGKAKYERATLEALQYGFPSVIIYGEAKLAGFTNYEDYKIALQAGFHTKADLDRFMEKNKNWQSLGFASQREWDTAKAAGFATKGAFDRWRQSQGIKQKIETKGTTKSLIASGLILATAMKLKG